MNDGATMNKAARRQEARAAWKGLMSGRGLTWRRVRKHIGAKPKLSMRKRIALTLHHFGVDIEKGK